MSDQILSIEHIGMAKIGDDIHITSTITKKEERKVEFEIVATLNDEIIAKFKENLVGEINPILEEENFLY